MHSTMPVMEKYAPLHKNSDAHQFMVRWAIIFGAFKRRERLHSA